MNTSGAIDLRALSINAARVTEALTGEIRDIVLRRLRRKGAVVALSGGIDSSVVAALCARALNPDRVFGILLPDMESSLESVDLAELLASVLGIRTEQQDITEILRAAGCYRRRDDAIRRLVPQYRDGFTCKVTMDGLNRLGVSLSSVVVEDPSGNLMSTRMTSDVYWEVVAAANFKQRTRKMIEYYHSDRLQYAVAGTPNRLEYDQGFFVKNGDGAADFKPIACLYKCQVYQLAEYLGIPDAIRRRKPTTDTFSLQQSQEEFYFGIPLEHMDLCLFAKDHGLPASAVAQATQMDEERIQCVFRSIESKRRATQYLHCPALLIQLPLSA